MAKLGIRQRLATAAAVIVSWFARRARPAAPARVRAIEAFGANPGNLGLRLHVPPGLVTGAPLVVLLHGCGQDPTAFAAGAGWLDLADRLGFLLLLPEQRAENNRHRCFNWFRPDDVRRERGEAASIREMIAAVAARHETDPERQFVAGLSAGGAMAVALLAAYPELFAGGAVVAGMAAGCAVDISSALACMARGPFLPLPILGNFVRSAAPSAYGGRWPRLAVWQGLADRTVNASNAAALVAQWCDVHGIGLIPSDEVRFGERARRERYGDVDGAPIVESWTIAGMGHGFPIAAERGCGRRGRYLLDVGICGAEQIARFWGLLPDEVPRQA